VFGAVRCRDKLTCLKKTYSVVSCVSVEERHKENLRRDEKSCG
jgi:hypothetical protein